MSSDGTTPEAERNATRLAQGVPRPRWYRLYYLLAAFDLFTVALALFLNHETRSTFARSVAVNQVWDQRLAAYSELGELAAAVDAPGNDVFDSLDVPGESARMRAARAAFDERFVALRRTRRGVRLEVQDWGRGFDPAAPVGGGPGERVGLSGMRERVGLLGGQYEVQSRPGVGTRVVAEVPLPAPGGGAAAGGK